MNKSINKPRAQLKPSAPRIEVRHTLQTDNSTSVPLLVALAAVTRQTRSQCHSITKLALHVAERHILSLIAERAATAFATAYATILSSDTCCMVKIMLQQLTADVKVGDELTATVTDVKDFGAIVEILRGRMGLLHMTEISHHASGRPVASLLK
eukprot:12992-Heterococcus_DN1.PRE.5